MSKQRIALLVSYDGTDYCGWQIQRRSEFISIQGELEKAFFKICGETIDVTGSGRTDSGVHASGQVAHAEMRDNIPPHKVREALNSQLPGSIRVLKSRIVDENFHARFSARRRDYAYQIYSEALPPAHLRDFCHFSRRRYSLEDLNRLAAPLRGIHDFTTFSAAGDQSKSKVREIFTSTFHREGPLLVYRIGGNAFLWRMVRSLTGTILQVAEQGGGPDEMRRRLESLNREEAGPTAPSRGLFLERIEYGSEYSFF